MIFRASRVRFFVSTPVRGEKRKFVCVTPRAKYRGGGSNSINFIPFEPLVVIVTMALPIVTPPEQDSSAPPEGGNRIDLHEVAKGWKAAIARAKDPATR